MLVPETFKRSFPQIGMRDLMLRFQTQLFRGLATDSLVGSGETGLGSRGVGFTPSSPSQLRTLTEASG